MRIPNWMAGLLAALLVSTAGAVPARADSAATVLRQMTSEGKLAEGLTTFEERVKRDPQDQEAKFSLGILKFLKAVEGLAADQYRFGLGSGIRQQLNVPLFREILENPNPAKVRYQDVREMLLRFEKGLAEAEKTLATVDTSNVKLEFRPGLIQLDLNGDGQATEEESFWKLASQADRGLAREDAAKFVIQADGGDVHWLRGYCHFLMAFVDFTTAHDYRELFERCGHLFYPDVDTPHTWIKGEPRPSDFFSFPNFADLVAAIHLINFEVIEPGRMQAAHHHLLVMIEQSRESWKRIEAETDDDAEWIPNPKQMNTAVRLPVTVNREVITGWHNVLDEVEALLTGKKLVPFWRGDVKVAEATGHGLGVNLKKVFLEPKRFDLVMWVSGTGAQPYLQEGEISTAETWNRLTRVFQGEFFGFAIWFN